METTHNRLDLTEYGFIQTATTDRWIEFQGHDFIVTIYNYFTKTFDGSEIIHHTFVINSKQFTSRSRPISQLEDWLSEKKISKK